MVALAFAVASDLPLQLRRDALLQSVKLATDLWQLAGHVREVVGGGEGLDMRQPLHEVGGSNDARGSLQHVCGPLEFHGITL